MSEQQIEIAREWLSECCESSEDGRVCAYTIQQYVEELEADKKRLDTMLSWHGVNWLFSWFEDAENTNPPTRDDIDSLEEQDHE